MNGLKREISTLCNGMGLTPSGPFVFLYLSLVDISVFDGVTDDDDGIIRVPMGFWAWTPTTPEEPYLAMAGQIQQFERILGYV